MIIDEIFEAPQQCPECGGISFSDLILAEKKDACYHKVKASAKVWPSAYASGRLVQCRKKGAANYGNKSEGMAEGALAEAVGMMIKGAAISGPDDQDIADRIAARTGGRVDSGSRGHHILIIYPTTQDRARAAVKIRKMFPGIELYKSGGNRNAIDEGMKADELSQYCEELVAEKGWDQAYKHARFMAQGSTDPSWGSVLKYLKSMKDGVAEGKEDKIAQLKKDHETAVYWSKNDTNPHKREAARQKAEKIKRHLETQYKQGVAEGSLNEFAPDGFNGDDDEGFSPEIAKMAQEHGFTKGVSLADGATLETAIKINHWHTQHGGMYKQYFAKGFKAGRMNKVNHDNKQYNLNLKLMKDGSIRHGEQGVAEEEPIKVTADVAANWPMAETRRGQIPMTLNPGESDNLEPENIAGFRQLPAYKQGQAAQQKAGKQLIQKSPYTFQSDQDWAYRQGAFDAQQAAMFANFGKSKPLTIEGGEQQKGADYRDPKEVDYDDEYDAMVARVKKLAGVGPMRTVYDPNKRVYRNMPTAQQPKK